LDCCLTPAEQILADLCAMLYKKHILILLVFQVNMSADLIGQQAYSDIKPDDHIPVFSEGFTDNSNSWITDNDWIIGKINDGQYEVTCKNFKQRTGLTYKPVSFDLTGDFEIETSFRLNSGTGALIFGLTNDFEHYRVEIDSKKNLFIIKDIPSRGRVEKLFSGKTGLVNDIGSANKITIRKIQTSYYFFINDLLFKQLSNLAINGDQVGFSVGLNSGIAVDYLNISSLKIITAPLLAEMKDTLKSSREIIPGDQQNKTIVPAIAAAGIIAAALPSGPEITWISPSGSNTQLDTYTARVRAKVKSGSELKSVYFYVNGTSKGEGEIKVSPDDSSSFITEKIINLNPGSNNIYLIATNNEGSSKSDLRYFTNPQADPPAIAWGNPVSSNSMVNTEILDMEVCIKSLVELVSAQVLVNGVQVGVGKVFQRSEADNCNYIWKPQIVLKDGDNSVYIIAENIAGSTTSENRVIRFSKTGSEKRLALVFGNSDYTNGTSLKNPVNDANLIEATLKELNFEVLKHTNAGKAEMERAIIEFSQKLPSYNVALFYYAGHGIQVDGINYLIPTDATLAEKVACKWEAISVTDIVSEFEKYPDNINVVILDACRNNPYRAWVRGAEAGFRFISDVSGTIIAYATAEGATAADGTGTNGLYTEELVRQMLVPQPVESVFKKTRVQVEMRSKGMQSPRESSGLRGEFYFKR
jgi:hypothetical protein